MDLLKSRILTILLGSAAMVFADTHTWTGGGANDNWTNAANWGGTAPVAGDDLIFAGSTRITPVNDFAAGTSFGSIQFNAGSGNFVLSGNSFSFASGAFAIQNLGTSGTITIQNAFTITTNSVVNTASGGTLVLNGNIGLGTSNLTFTGNGIANSNGNISGSGKIIVNTSNTTYTTLNGTNTNTGAVDIQGGTLKLGSTSALGTSSLVTVYAGASLDLNGQNFTATLPLTLNGTGIASGGALQNSSATSATYAGLITLASSASIIANTGSINISNTGTITGASSNLTLGGAAGGSLSSAIATGNGGLTKQDAGTWVMSGASTYTGFTLISAGTLQMARDNALASTTDLTVNGVLDMKGYNLEVGSLAGSGTIDKTSGGGTNTLTVGRNNTGSTFSGVIQNSSGKITLTKTGTAALTLSGLNTYTGPTLVSGGTLKVGVANAMSAGSDFTVNGILDLNGFSLTLGSLAGSGTVDNTAGAATVSLTVGATNASTTFSGIIKNASQTLDLSKNGTGTFTLSGANTYTGSTNVNAGTLNVTGSFSAGGGTLTAKSGTTLAGNGMINRLVDIKTGATLSPGDGGVGTLTISSLTFGELANANFDLGVSSDLVVVTGDMIHNGLLNVNNSGGFGFGTYTLFQVGGTITNWVMRVGSVPLGAYGYSILVGGTDISLKVDPLAMRSYTPADNATNVANTGLFLQMEFNQAVTTNAGNVVLRKTSNDSIIQTTSISSAEAVSKKDSLLLGFEGVNSMTVLAGATVTTALSTSVVHTGSNSVEFVTTSDWDWAQAEVTGSLSTYDTVSAWVYAKQAGCALIVSQSGSASDWTNGSCLNLTVNGWKKISMPVATIGTPSDLKSIGVQFGAPGTYYVDDMKVSRVANTTFRIPVTSNLQPNTSYYVNIDAGIVRDVDLNPFAGVSGKTTWNFSTINNAPHGVGITVDSLQENAPVGTVVGSLLGIDPDPADVHTFAFVAGAGDTDNSSFTIVGSELRTNASFDFESKSSYSIRILGTDANGLTVEGVIALHVFNKNENPLDIILSANNVMENAPVGRFIGTLTSTDTDEPLTAQTYTYSLATGTGSTDNASFTVRNDSLLTAASFDFESKSSYSIRIRTTDQGGLTYEEQFTINATDSNDAPVVVNGDTAQVTMDENQSLAATIVANDQDLDVPTYQLVGGTDQALFQINANTGVLSFVTSPDFENPTDSDNDGLYSVVVEASDGVLTDSQTVLVEVLNVNDIAPIITGTPIRPNAYENALTATTIQATDEDGDIPTYSLQGGADMSHFSINATSGNLTFLSAPDKENPGDSDQNNEYLVVVRASDGIHFDEDTVKVKVLNVNEAPEFSGVDTLYAWELDTLAMTAIAVDPDSGITTITYTISGGTDAALLKIKGSTGVVTFLSLPDYENPKDANKDGVYQLIIRASDGMLFGEKTFYVRIRNVNEPPAPYDSLKIVRTDPLKGKMQWNMGSILDTISVAMNTNLSIVSTFHDWEEDGFALKLVSGPDGMSATNVGDSAIRLQWTPNQAGVYKLQIESKDDSSLVDTLVLWINVIGNQAPTYWKTTAVASSSTGNVSRVYSTLENSLELPAESKVRIKFWFQDPEEDSFTARLDSASESVMSIFKDGSLQLEWDAPAKGSLKLWIEVEDSQGAKDTVPFTVQITDPLPVGLRHFKTMNALMKMKNFDLMGRRR